MSSSGAGSSKSRRKRPRVNASASQVAISPASGKRDASQLQVDTLVMEVQSNCAELSSFQPTVINDHSLKILEKASLMISRMCFNVRAYRKTKSERPVEEVLLPLELLEHAFCFLSPRELGIVMATCRGLRLAVHAAIVAKTRALGIQAIGIDPMTTHRLHKMIPEVENAAELLQNLNEANYKLLERYDKCVLAKHIAVLMPYINRGLSGERSDRESRTSYDYGWRLLTKLVAYPYKEWTPRDWLVENVEMVIAAINVTDFPNGSSNGHKNGSNAMLCFKALPMKAACEHLPRILPALHQNQESDVLYHLLDYLETDVPKSILAANRDTLLQVLPPLTHYPVESWFCERVRTLAGFLCARLAN